MEGAVAAQDRYGAGCTKTPDSITYKEYLIMEIDYTQLAAELEARKRAVKRQRNPFDIAANIAILIVVGLCVAIAWEPFIKPRLLGGESTPAPAATVQPLAQPRTQPAPVYVAPPVVVEQPAPIEQPAAPPAPIEVVPTAAVYVAPTVQVGVIPQAMPAVAPGSDVRPAPLPTLVIPTPLTAGLDYSLSEDGKCVRAPRGGKMYEVCQEWKYKQHEVMNVGDYIRTGLLPGVEVNQ